MADCWNILRIQPTGDADRIRKAYLDLVKQYHPDTVTEPDQKRKYTILCAQINQAYRQALKQARPADPPGAPDLSTTGAAGGEGWRPVANAPIPRQDNILRPAFKSGVTVTAFLGVFVVLQIISAFAAPIESIPETVRVAAGFAAVLFIVVVLYGLILAGVMDLALIWLFPRNILFRLGLERHEDKVIWVSVVAANFALFFFTDLIAPPPENGPGITLFDCALRFVAAAVAPGLFGMRWLRETIRYRRAQKYLSELPLS